MTREGSVVRESAPFRSPRRMVVKKGTQAELATAGGRHATMFELQATAYGAGEKVA